MTDNSKRNLRPRQKSGTPTKTVGETFRAETTAPKVERTKTSLALNQEKYDQLRIYSVTQRVPLRDIFDEAMDLYLARYVHETAHGNTPHGKTDSGNTVHGSAVGDTPTETA